MSWPFALSRAGAGKKRLCTMFRIACKFNWRFTFYLLIYLFNICLLLLVAFHPLSELSKRRLFNWICALWLRTFCISYCNRWFLSYETGYYSIEVFFFDVSVFQFLRHKSRFSTTFVTCFLEESNRLLFVMDLSPSSLSPNFFLIICK